MSVDIIDRRLGSKNKSTINKHRFMKRLKEDIRKVVKDSVVNGKVSDIIGKKDYKISVKKSTIYEPQIDFKRGSGATKSIHVGNKEFIKGDTIPKPPDMDGENGSSPDGEGEDEFRFVLTQEDFLNIFFEDMALPRLLKAKLLGIEKPRYKRGGISKTGIPPRINILRTFRQSLGRQAAIKSPLEEKLKLLEKYLEFHGRSKELHEDLTTTEYPFNETYHSISKEAQELREDIKAIPFLDDIDLRYNRLTKENSPTHKAVMFCVMDVSASMGEWEKEVAKRFFMLLYIFLTRVYKTIDIVFIRYHSEAEKVDEQEFFYSKETGGTLLSPALKIVEQVMKERYSSDWNIYCCHASDGDNYEEDNPSAQDILERILPKMQYYAYVQVSQAEFMFNLVSMDNKELWKMFVELEKKFPNLIGKGIISTIPEIWPVFQKLFEEEDADA